MHMREAFLGKAPGPNAFRIQALACLFLIKKQAKDWTLNMFSHNLSVKKNYDKMLF